MSDESADFGAMLEEFERQGGAATRGPKAGQTVKGTVMSIGESAVFIDLGGKSEGVLDREQVLSRDGELLVSVGDEIEARVVEAGGASGSVVLKISIGGGNDGSLELQQAFEHGLPVEGSVTGTNKGGVEVQVAGVRAFCPVSQLDIRFVEDSESFVGQRLKFRVTKYEGGKRPNVVLSRRALLEEEAKGRAAELRENLDSGKTVTGVVTSLKPYGAFVDLGGLEGMIHVSELSHTRVDDPSDVVAVGQSVTAKVLRIEPDKNGKDRIALSIKALAGDPWADASDTFTRGARLTGTVTRLANFGAFIEVAPAVEGLAHISQLSDKRIRHPRDVVSVGESLEVEVLSYEPKERRLSLSLANVKSANSAAEEQANVREHSPAAPKSLGTFGDLLKKKI